MGGRSAVMPELFSYGIQTEASDIRAHVSVVNRTIYVFPTRNGVRAVAENNCPEVFASQPGVNGATSKGWVVGIDKIDDLRCLRFHSWGGWDGFLEKLTTSEKGRRAVACVQEAMKRGKFPFWIDASESDRENVQIKGTDILVFCRKKVQVKCDFRGGEKPLGTGNLYLQSAERNPLGAH